MPSIDEKKIGKAYWRSLEEFADTPEFQKFVENEFPSMLDEVITPSNRRTFLKLMGASMALAGAGLAGCRRWPDEKIAPFAHRPENYVPGETVMFATSMEVGGVGRGLLVQNYDGRPIKIEGNPLHPLNGNAHELPADLSQAERLVRERGVTDAFAQAATLQFYDPDRSRNPVKREFIRREDDPALIDIVATPSSWNEFISESSPAFASLQNTRGSGLAILAEHSTSPVLEETRRRFETAFPRAAWYEYEPLSRDNEIEGSRLAFGEAYRPQISLKDAEILVCFDADPLMGHPASTRLAREFANNRRQLDEHMCRLYSVEGTLSLTGANADHRLAVRSQDVAAIAAAVAAKLGEHGVSVLGANRFSDVGVDGAWSEFIDALAGDLAARAGRGVVMAGPRQPAEVHALVHAINFALGNVGQTIQFTAEPAAGRFSNVEAIRRLTDDLNAGIVTNLLIIGGNPAYDAPADLNFRDALMKTSLEGMTTHLSLYDDETSNLCRWHLNAAHFLESWGATRGWDGTVAAVQPQISPLYEGRTPAELLALVLNDGPVDSFTLTRQWFGDPGTEREAQWRRFLHDGVLAESAWPAQNVTLAAGPWATQLRERIDAAAPSSPNAVEVIFAQDASVYDGRFANNGWLQEMPDPIAKISWDNAAFMGPATASELGVGSGSMVSIGTETIGPLTIAAFIVPGHAEGCITINLGYGRGAPAGRIGQQVGFNAYQIRSTDAMHFAPAMAISRSGGSYDFATVQDHHAMDAKVTNQGKEARLPVLIWETSLARYQNEGAPGAFYPIGYHPHEFPVVSLWEEFQWKEHTYRWGMSIDLNACTGCSACMIACQAENNVPIVGKDQVARGREMHWIRIDRYYKGPNVNRPEVVFQPVTCQHCENAPCESVCPVAATTHDRDGLNVMVYNRCVGTRYCSNNCPYKVRRFNFYDWHAENPRAEGLKPPSFMFADQQQPRAFAGGEQVKKMAFNPEVTVRPRGVMEKCTFCVQRINRVKIRAKNEWVNTPKSERPSLPHIRDGAITPACAQACPTEAIVFGDLNNPESRVAKLHAERRSYGLLEDLNTKPRNEYLGRIRNYNTTLRPVPAGAGVHGHAEDAHQEEAAEH